MQPAISVIVPNLNSSLIDKTIYALRNQTIDLNQVEILVVGLDQPGLVKSDDLVQFIDTGRFTSAAFNRNLGMREARGEILCFTDADCVPAPDWLARLTAPYASDQIDVVGGGVVFDTGNYWSTCDNFSWFHKFLATTSPGERDHLPTLNLSMRRRVLEQAGGMDESYPLAAGEDTEWTERMRAHGFRLYFEPAAIVTHRAERTTLRAMLHHGYNYGRFSTKLRHASTHTSISTQAFHPLLRHWGLLLLTSPLLSLLASWRTLSIARTPGAWWIFPGIWLSKMAWCIGAAQILYSRWVHDIISATLS